MYYAFKLSYQDAEGFRAGGEYLGTDEDLSALLARFKDDSIEIIEGPTIGATTRGIVENCRITFNPIRQTFGTGKNVRDFRPWSVFIHGTAVNCYETQAAALKRLEYVKINPLNKPNGCPWQ